MNRRAVSSDQAPKALGPYSQAIVAGGLVFCSGMAGIDPASGTIPEVSKPRPSGRCSALPPCSSPPGRPWRTSSRRRSSTPTPRTSAGSTRSTPGTCPILRPPGLPRADVRLPLGLLVPIEAMAVLPGASASLGGVRDGAGHRSSPAPSRRREAGQRRTPTASLLLATSAPVAAPERPGVRASAGRTPVLKRPSMLPIAMRPHARRSVAVLLLRRFSRLASPDLAHVLCCLGSPDECSASSWARTGRTARPRSTHTPQSSIEITPLAWMETTP